MSEDSRTELAQALIEHARELGNEAYFSPALLALAVTTHHEVVTQGQSAEDLSAAELSKGYVFQWPATYDNPNFFDYSYGVQKFSDYDPHDPGRPQPTYLPSGPSDDMFDTPQENPVPASFWPAVLEMHDAVNLLRTWAQDVWVSESEDPQINRLFAALDGLTPEITSRFVAAVTATRNALTEANVPEIFYGLNDVLSGAEQTQLGPYVETLRRVATKYAAIQPAPGSQPRATNTPAPAQAKPLDAVGTRLDSPDVKFGGAE